MGLDLESYRLKERLPYAGLAELIKVTQARQARSYALGETWPGSVQLEIIIKATGGEVTVQAMHDRRLAFLRRKRRRSRDGQSRIEAR